MDTLQATYTDNDDDIEEEPSTHPPPTAASYNDAVLPESNGIIKDEPLTPNIINHHNSPKLPPETDGDDEQEPDDDDLDDDEEEEQQQQSPTKKQKQIPDSPKPEITEMPSPAADAITLTPLPENGKALVSKASSKKSKKKSKDVWVTSTRKGKKKTKHASSFKHNNDDAAREDEKVLITPVPRFPDRNNDSPELSICLSKVYKAEKVEVSEDRLSAGSTKGYRMVRATRGVTEGAWYFEIKVVHLGETGHTRLGWSTEMADLQAPVGYDGNGYGYRDVDGSKVHKALREKYGEEGYKEGDVIGFYINLPDGESYAPNLSRLIWYKGQRGVYAPNVKEDPPKTVPGSEITYYKNGICQGVAFKDLHGGRYYPAASMYTLPNQPNCVVKFNFGPEFERFPDDFGERPVPRPMIEVPYQSFDARVENGTPWNTTRMCPMLKVMEEDDGEILKGDEIVD